MERIVCQTLKRRLEEAGMSQEELVEKVETNVRGIRRIGNGEVKTRSYLEEICKE